MANHPGTVCHILPCSIEKDLTAPVAQYFRPTPLPATALPRNLGSDNGADGADAAVTVMAAQFRGRGLLCAVDAATPAARDDAAPSEEQGPASHARPTELPSDLLGVVLAPSSSAAGLARPLQVVEKFQHVFQWSHEHDVQQLLAERRGSDKHGLAAVRGWCRLAREVSLSRSRQSGSPIPRLLGVACCIASASDSVIRSLVCCSQVHDPIPIDP